MQGCYPGGTSEFCDRIHRFPTGEIDFIEDLQTNSGSDRLDGLDLSLSYQRQMPLGRLGVRGDAT